MKKEEVIKAIECRGPGEVPALYNWVADETLRKYGESLRRFLLNFPDDLVLLGYGSVSFPTESEECFVDEWGCRWEKAAVGWRCQPALKNWNELDSYLSKIPDSRAPNRFGKNASYKTAWVFGETFIKHPFEEVRQEEIIKESKQNFEQTWTASARLIPKNTSIEIKGTGKSHPVKEMIQKSREILLNMGFNEVENKTILSDTDVYKEYGPEAPVILDRAFYLSKLPRPDIGLGKERIAKIQEIIGKFDVNVLQGILRSYKKGEIEGDDFVEEMVTKLRIDAQQATDIISKVFSEFKNLTPETTNQTLRSHMSATWYHTLAALQNKSSYPLALFSVGPRYRNEQREDKGHLRVHNSASIVIMDPNMSLEAGRKITREILKRYGFKDVKFETKKATSKYYAKDQEQEVFAKHKGEWFEIADIGMYSVISLANFGIKHPVFNAGFGIERLVMVLQGNKDIRQLVYPQFYLSEYSDEEIAKAISYINEPKTERGKRIAEAIERTAREYRNEIAPCEFIAYEDDELLVKIVEREEGKRLIGPAGFNEIYVDGGIFANTKIKGKSSGINFMKAIAKKVAYKIEKERKSFTLKRKIVKSLSNLNLMVPKSINLFIKSHNQKIDVYGPVFVEIKVEYKSRG